MEHLPKVLKVDLQNLGGVKHVTYCTMKKIRKWDSFGVDQQKFIGGHLGRFTKIGYCLCNSN